MAALGVLGVLYSADRVDRQLDLIEQRQEWPTVQARVLSLDKASVFDSEYMADTLTVGVKFEYEVEGHRYSGYQEWDISCERWHRRLRGAAQPQPAWSLSC